MLRHVQGLALFLEGRDAENPFALAVGLWLRGCMDTSVMQGGTAEDKHELPLLL